MDHSNDLAELERLAELGGGAERLRRQHDAGKLTRAGADRSAVRSGHLRGGRQARHAPVPRLRHGRPDRPRRRRRRRPRASGRPARVRVRAGLHGLRRLAVGDQRREDREGHGPGDEHGRADRRAERLRRRADPGRRALARRLRRHLPAQHARFGRHSADLRDHGTVRRRRGVFAGDHRFHRHGARHELHVRHRPRRREDRHARGRHEGGSSAAP